MPDTVTDFASFKAPLYVAWELTHHCNADCLHCYSSSSPKADSSNDLNTEESLSVIDGLADAGLMVLAFSGGEPMLRKDWPVLVRHAIDRGLSVNIGSNGSCITPRTADELQELGVHSVTISLDSHLSAVHDRFRRLPGLFDKAVKAIELLTERGVRVVVGFTPTTINADDGEDVIALAYRLGANAVNLSEYVPAGRGTTDLALTPEGLRDVLNQWIALREHYKGRMEIIWHDCRVGMLCSEEDKRDYVGCGAGRLVGRILPDGTVTPCVFLPTAIGSLREDSFSALWRRSGLLSQFRVRTGSLSGNCGECDHISTCGGCRAVAYAYSDGDPLAGDPHCWIKPEQSEDIDTMAEVLTNGESLPV